MQFLQPDAERAENGVLVREKIIPWGAVWPRDAAGFRKGSPFKADLLLSGGTGRVRGVTIHNTGRIAVSPQTTPAEQYTRATWPNANMNSVRVHYYVDAFGAWQNLREDEVGWHTGDGTYGPGNNTTVAIEIIMDGSGDADDLAAEENGARLAASILRRHGLTERNLYTHRELSPVGKYCPAFLLPRWDEFRKKVGRYLAELRAHDGDADAEQPGSPSGPSGGLIGRREDETEPSGGNAPGSEEADGASGAPGSADADGSPGADSPSGSKPAQSGEDAGASAGAENSPGALYRVQVGAFRSRENAARLLERLTAHGFPGYIRRDGE